MLYCSQLQKGGSYKALKKSVVIAILNFTHFKDDEDFLRCYKIVDQKHNNIMGTLQWHFIELPKFKFVQPQPGAPTNQSNLSFWLDFLKNADKKAEIPQQIPNEIAQAYGLVQSSEFNDDDKREIRERIGLLDIFDQQQMELANYAQLVQSLIGKRVGTEEFSEDEKALLKKLNIEGFK